MGMNSAKLGVSTALLTWSLAAPAATVSVEAFLVTQHGVQPSADIVLNAPNCTTGSTGSTECASIVQSIGLGASPVDTGTVTKTRSTFDTGNVSQVPNFVMNGNARAFASLGQLHASTFVQIQGAGGNNVSIGGRAHAQITDRVQVKSSVLPDGTSVSVRVLLNVSGSGGGRLSFGLNGFNQQVGQSNDSAFNVDSLEDFATTFSAKVGDVLSVTYGLTAFTRMISNGWSAINVLNGRNNAADYGNSAFLFMEGVDPSLGVTLNSDTGFSYAFPAAVPVPGAVWLLASALPLAWRLGRQRRALARQG